MPVSIVEPLGASPTEDYVTERKTVTREQLAAALLDSGLTRDSGYLRLADAIFAALPESTDEGDRAPATTWLVERGQPEGQVPTVWWMDDGWTDLASEARRYTRAAAEAVIARKFTPPPSRGRPSARAVEHMFFESHTLSETSHD